MRTNSPQWYATKKQKRSPFTMQAIRFDDPQLHVGCRDDGAGDGLLFQQTDFCEGVGHPQFPHHHLLRFLLLHTQQAPWNTPWGGSVSMCCRDSFLYDLLFGFLILHLSLAQDVKIQLLTLQFCSTLDPKGRPVTSDDILLSGISGLPLIPFPISVCLVIFVLMVHSPVFTENSSINVWVFVVVFRR